MVNYSAKLRNALKGYLCIHTEFEVISTMASKKTVKKRRPKARPRVKRPTASKTPKAPRCVCGGSCDDTHARLPGYLLIALGMMAVPLNFGLFPQLDWARAWPLVLVLFGFVLVVRTVICKQKR